VIPAQRQADRARTAPPSTHELLALVGPKAIAELARTAYADAQRRLDQRASACQLGVWAHSLEVLTSYPPFEDEPMLDRYPPVSATAPNQLFSRDIT